MSEIDYKSTAETIYNLVLNGAIKEAIKILEITQSCERHEYVQDEHERNGGVHCDF